MKIVAVILAIITITLSAIPCDDNMAVGTEHSTSVGESSHSENHNTMDACSPFCSCVCCASVVIKPFVQDTQLYSEIKSKVVSTYYKVAFTNNHLSLIFQPPQA